MILRERDPLCEVCGVSPSPCVWLARGKDDSIKHSTVIGEAVIRIRTSRQVLSTSQVLKVWSFPVRLELL